MKFKSPNPEIGDSTEESFANLISYIEDIKSETAAKLTLLENTMERIKEKLDSLGEVST